MGEGVLDNDISRSVMVDIQSPDRQLRFGRLEGQLSIVASGEVKLNAEAGRPPRPAGIQENRSIQLVIVVKIRHGEGLHERRGEIQLRPIIRPRQRARKPVLRPQPWRGESHCADYQELNEK